MDTIWLRYGLFTNKKNDLLFINYLNSYAKIFMNELIVKIIHIEIILGLTFSKYFYVIGIITTIIT